MRLGYNTNGFAFHRWEDALELLAEIGYGSVAITLDQSCLNPFGSSFAAEVDRMRRQLRRLGLASVIETGARFLLDPRTKHEPTLLTADPAERWRRVEFLRRAIDVAAELGSDAVSFWSGIRREGISEPAAFDRLTEGCRQVLCHAESHRVRLGFEPEPGMFVESFSQFERLRAALGGPALFGLTIDIGHVHCVEDGSIADHLRRWRDLLFNVHIEDMRRGVHEHLMFGDGEIDFAPVMQALREIGYAGGLHVELSRHSHVAPEAARQSFRFLTGLQRMPQAGVPTRPAGLEVRPT
jgi:sugar phosphate isomerase/epimerase